MNWQFFNTILYINLDSRVDRLIQIHQELQRIGITDAVRIPGVMDENRTKGFNQAQRNALESANGVTLILEDDVIFKDWGHLEQALSELPDDWDLCYLGANVAGSDLCEWPWPKPVSQHLCRVLQAWTTHAIAYSEKGIKKVLELWDHTNGQMFDDVLRCNIESNLNAYIVNPMVADQRPGYSDIWRGETDYGFFKQGNERMAI